jgi:glycosyltransferase involved in cell wall biosynthesis
MDFVLRQGVEAAVCARLEATDSAYPLPPDVPVWFGRSPGEALAEFSPDVVHVHWLHVAGAHLSAFERAGVPVTVRGHSCDFHPEAVRSLTPSPVVQRIYLFPHFAARVPDDARITPMPVCYPSQLYYPPDQPKDRRLVFRASAGLGTKDVASFIATARHCPEFRFVLAMTRADELRDFPDQMIALNGKRRNGFVDIRVAVQHEEVAALSRGAAIYFRSHDPSTHPYGMPASIAEAMATGSWILARDAPEVRQFVGSAGGYYGGRTRQAAKQLNDTLTWTDEAWEVVEQRARERAGAFSDDVVLPPLVADWRSLAT